MSHDKEHILLNKTATEHTEQRTTTPLKRDNETVKNCIKYKDYLQRHRYQVVGVLENTDATDPTSTVRHNDLYAELNKGSEESFNLIGDLKTDGDILQRAENVRHYGSLEGYKIAERSENVTLQNATAEHSIARYSVNPSVHDSQARYIAAKSSNAVVKRCTASSSIAREAENAIILRSEASKISVGAENTVIADCHATTIAGGATKTMVFNSVAEGSIAKNAEEAYVE